MSASSKLPYLVRQHGGVVAHPWPFLLDAFHHQQVCKQMLTPNMAIRVCNYPTITNLVLSREITKLVIVHPEAKLRDLLQKQKS